MIEGGFNDNDDLKNPTHEYYPSKGYNNGLPIYSQFLQDAMPSNVLLSSCSFFFPWLTDHHHGPVVSHHLPLARQYHIHGCQQAGHEMYVMTEPAMASNLCVLWLPLITVGGN